MNIFGKYEINKQLPSNYKEIEFISLEIRNRIHYFYIYIYIFNSLSYIFLYIGIIKIYLLSEIKIKIKYYNTYVHKKRIKKRYKTRSIIKMFIVKLQKIKWSNVWKIHIDAITFWAQSHIFKQPKNTQHLYNYLIKLHSAYPTLLRRKKPSRCIPPSRYADRVVAINSPLKSAGESRGNENRIQVGYQVGLKSRVNKKPFKWNVYRVFAFFSFTSRLSIPLRKLHPRQSSLQRDSYVFHPRRMHLIFLLYSTSASYHIAESILLCIFKTHASRVSKTSSKRCSPLFVFRHRLCHVPIFRRQPPLWHSDPKVVRGTHEIQSFEGRH